MSLSPDSKLESTGPPHFFHLSALALRSPPPLPAQQQSPFSSTSITVSLRCFRRNSKSSMSMDSNVPRALCLFALVSISCLLLYGAADSLRWLSSPSVSSNSFTFYSDSVSGGEDLVAKEKSNLKIERLLKKAAMEDGTVILTTLNQAWAEPNSVIDLFLESFRIGVGTRRLLNHLVIVALDLKAYSRCLQLHHHCFPLVTEGVDFSLEAYFMTPSYLKMMWRRIDFLRFILELGYNIVFTDADVMWFRDPFPRFYSDADFQIACDHFKGSPIDRSNKANGGFNYVKSNNRSIQFYKFWHSSQHTFPGYHDQDVLNVIKFGSFVQHLGLKMRFLDTAFFGGLCEPSRDLNLVCTMHANCCYGLDSKLQDLRTMIDDWKNFMSLPLRYKRMALVSWSVPRNCSLDALRQHDSPQSSTELELDE